MMTPDDLSGDDALAAEYVLGVLSTEDRQAIVRRLAGDPDFARRVEAWEKRLAALGDDFTEHAPSPAVKAAIDQRLFGKPTAAPRFLDLWQSLTIWRGLAAASLVAVVLVLGLLTTRQDARLVASLTATGSEVRYLALYDAAQASVGLSYLGGAKPSDRDFELWLIVGANPPVSVGIIPEGGNVQLPLSSSLRQQIQQGATLAISLEPKGGSTTGQPTGAVVAVGQLRTL